MREIIILILVCWSTQIVYGQGLIIQSGSQMVVSGDAALVINDGSFTNNGTFASGSGSVYMKGSVPAADAKIGGSNYFQFNKLVIDKSSNGVQLERNLTLDPFTSIQMDNGDLDLNGKSIFLSFGANILNESETSRIKGDSGKLEILTNYNAPTDINPGNLGLRMTSTNNLGTFTIQRIHGAQTINGGQSTDRHYKVKYYFTGLNVDYVFEYFDAELNGINEDYLKPWNHQNIWQQQNADAASTSTNFVQVNGLSETDTLWALSTGKLQMTPKVLLEGNYSGSGLMTDNLRANNLIPTTEPYTGLGFTHVGGGGETCDPSVFASTGDNAIVDWIFLEWRDKNNSNTVLQTRSALLQKDGDVVDVDGVSPVQIASLVPDDYYLAIYHRNHLAVRTTAAQSLTPIASAYDFTSTLSQAWDNPAISSNDAMSDNGGVFLLHQANVNSDNFINIIDFIQAKVNTTPNQSNVYLTYDMNLDGNTNVIDFIITKSESTPNKSAHID